MVQAPPTSARVSRSFMLLVSCICFLLLFSPGWHPYRSYVIKILSRYFSGDAFQDWLYYSNDAFLLSQTVAFSSILPICLIVNASSGITTKASGWIFGKRWWLDYLLIPLALRAGWDIIVLWPSSHLAPVLAKLVPSAAVYLSPSAFDPYAGVVYNPGALSSMLLALLYFVVVVAAEVTFWHGFLQLRVQMLTGNALLANVTQATAVVLWHTWFNNPPLLLGVFVTSLVKGYIFQRRRCLGAPFLFVLSYDLGVLFLPGHDYNLLWQVGHIMGWSS